MKKIAHLEEFILTSLGPRSRKVTWNLYVRQLKRIIKSGAVVAFLNPVKNRFLYSTYRSDPIGCLFCVIVFFYYVLTYLVSSRLVLLKRNYVFCFFALCYLNTFCFGNIMMLDSCFAFRR